MVHGVMTYSARMRNQHGEVKFPAKVPLMHNVLNVLRENINVAL